MILRRSSDEVFVLADEFDVEHKSVKNSKLKSQNHNSKRKTSIGMPVVWERIYWKLTHLTFLSQF